MPKLKKSNKSNIKKISKKPSNKGQKKGGGLTNKRSKQKKINAKTKKINVKPSLLKDKADTIQSPYIAPEIIPHTIYLDNNATTLICKQAEKTYHDWLKCYNPSSSTKLADNTKCLLKDSEKYILDHCNCPESEYKVVFTSGATESNCFIIRSTCEAYFRIRKIKPHIIISEVEHHSSLECANNIKTAGYADVECVPPNMYGCVLVDEIEKRIRPNTCLISIIFANNETGSISNIKEIGNLSHKHKIPFHTDAVQIFGKVKIDIPDSNIDALSACFHKLYGPKGVGLLILKNTLIEGYELKSQIAGSQQSGLRGGTENVAGIASSISAMKHAFENRKEKNKKLLDMRNKILDSLNTSDIIKIGNYKDYLEDILPTQNEIVILGPPRDKLGNYLPNTILLSICKPIGEKFCNVKFKEELDNLGIVVSISSACLTSSDKASHVVTALGAPPVIKRGILRISMGDTNTEKDIDSFLKIFYELLEKYLKE